MFSDDVLRAEFNRQVRTKIHNEVFGVASGSITGLTFSKEVHVGRIRVRTTVQVKEGANNAHVLYPALQISRFPFEPSDNVVYEHAAAVVIVSIGPNNPSAEGVIESVLDNLMNNQFFYARIQEFVENHCDIKEGGAGTVPPVA